MPSKSGRNILECYSRNVKLLPVQNLFCCANSPASPALTISIAKRKRNLWPSSPPSFSAPLRLRQSRRASTYLQGNSRVDERSIGHFNGPIPLTKVSSCRRILTAWDGSWFCGRDTSDWRFQPRLFSSLRPRFEISNTRTSFSVRVAISQ